MLVKTGLLVVSNPKQIGKILSSIQKQVKNTLYIQLLSALTEPLGSFQPSIFTSWPKYSQTISGIYTQAATHCRDLDVRVLLTGLKHNLSIIQTRCPIDLVIFDKKYNRKEIDGFLKGKIANITKECEVITLDASPEEKLAVGLQENEKVYKHSVLGGTFDRLHIAHKLLLSEAALRSDSKITVGVTEETMLETKVLWELIEPIDTRVNSVNEFLFDICPELEVSVVPIADPFGPTQSDPSMELIVVSDETSKGGHKVNEVRQSKGLAPLDVLTVELIDEPHRNPNEEQKISSSTVRMRLLGTLLKPVETNTLVPSKPYVIGLTGGIASGKSAISGMLAELGAEVINCDMIGHSIYKQGKPCYTEIVKEFGDTILDEQGEVNRKTLGAIVFGNDNQLQKLNSLVWPAIGEEVLNQIKISTAKVVAVEAAVLSTAGWKKYCHEVWTTLIPPAEASKRLQNRNSLTEAQAIARINSQASNKSYIDNAHVVLCTLWAVEYTRTQVEKAWNLLQNRLLS